MNKSCRLLFLCSAAASLAASPRPAAAQLVRKDGSAAAQSPVTPKQTPLGKQRTSQEVQITGDQLWSDTGIDVQPGEHIVVTATGNLRYADAKEDNGPDGIPRGFKDLLRILPFNSAGRGALIGRVGEADIAQPFLLGAGRNVVAAVPGRLAIGINQISDDTGEGTYTVHIDIHAPDSVSTYHPVRQVKTISGVNDGVFTKVPRRVADKEGNPGDIVNFLILGSEDAMQKVFTAAGWVKVDVGVRGSGVCAGPAS